MNKTISINLSGQVFQIDEPAYQELKNYLEAIHKRFADVEGGQEIIADIETRIAELFNEKLNSRKQVITQADVAEVKRIMGNPEDFDSALDANDTAAETRFSKRLFRNPDDKVIAGVCSGISAYLGIADPVWIRLLFVIMALAGVGSPVLIYFILWIIIPQAQTPSEKLQMRGKSINISNIEKTIRNDLDDLKKKMNHFNSAPTRNMLSSLIGRTIKLITSVTILLLRALLKVTAVILLVSGILIFVFFMLTLLLPVTLSIIPVALLYPLIFPTKTLLFLFLLGIVLFVGIPAFWLTYAGLRILFGKSSRVKNVGISALGLWLVSGFILLFVLAKMVPDFLITESVREEIPLIQPQGDTLVLGTLSGRFPDNNYYNFFGKKWIYTDSAILLSGNVELDIQKSYNSTFQLIRYKSSRGRNHHTASLRAQAIEYGIDQQDSLLLFDEYLAFSPEHSYRDQKVKIILKVPEGKSVLMGRGVADILDEAKNLNDAYNYEMIGHVWTMQAGGLVCMDCEEAENFADASRAKSAQMINLSDFETVEAEGFFNLQIKQGDVYKIYTEGGREFPDKLRFDKEGSHLKISQSSIQGFWGGGNGTVYITMPVLREVKITGRARADVKGFEGKYFKAAVGGASRSTIDITASRVTISINGISEVILKGNTEELNAEVEGASRLKAFDCQAARGKIYVDGDSYAEVHVNEKLEATVKGASELLYKGLPEIISEVKGFSSIKPSRN
ncbi:MAG: hypothetical protein KatS3mg031_1350 [Chitinophagales bacterium]|nr:MAG: hypothetical protein KatS3mg031_1350 [Chitinophagales bacterium]